VEKMNKKYNEEELLSPPCLGLQELLILISFPRRYCHAIHFTPYGYFY